MMTKKILLAAAALIVLPSFAQAMANTYTACDRIDLDTNCSGEHTICYQGLFPCNKWVYEGGVEREGKCGGGSPLWLPCQQCHLFIGLTSLVNFLVLPPTGLVWWVGMVMVVIGAILRLVSNKTSELRGLAHLIFKTVAVGVVLCLTVWIVTNTLFMAAGASEWKGFTSEGPGRWFKVTCPVLMPQ